MEWRDERRYINYTLWIVIILVSVHLSRTSYLLFHSAAEMSAVVIAFCIFVILFNSMLYEQKGFMVFLGFGYASVGIFDFLHMLSYEGMGVIVGYTANLPTQLWIIGRFLESITILAASFYYGRQVNIRYIAITYAATANLLLFSVFWWDIFPDCFVQPGGLTTFKIVSEYIIIAILFVSLFYNFRINRQKIQERAYYFVIAAIAFKIIAELFFTLYIGVYDMFNMLGHVLKFVSYYFVYKAVVQISIQEPYIRLEASNKELLASREQYRQLNEQLEQKVSERTAELKDAIKELEAFSYSVSHDLREPLRGIDGFSQALLEDYDESLDEQGKHYLQRIRAATTKMGQLINDILDLSRLNRTQLAIKEVDLTLIASEIANQFKANNPERNLNISIMKNMKVNCDRRSIQIALENLFGNAVKYTRNKDVAVIEFGEKLIDGDRVFYIKDNGCGFDMAYENKLFIAFQRLHSPREYEGTGIGLALVNTVIKRHGGKVWAESAIDQGTALYFMIKDRSEEVE